MVSSYRLLVPQQLVFCTHPAAGAAGPGGSLSAGLGAPCPVRCNHIGPPVELNLSSLISTRRLLHLWPSVTNIAVECWLEPHYLMIAAVSHILWILWGFWVSHELDSTRPLNKCICRMWINHPTCSSPSRILSRNNKSSRDRSSFLCLLPNLSLLSCMLALWIVIFGGWMGWKRDSELCCFWSSWFQETILQPLPSGRMVV